MPGLDIRELNAQAVKASAELVSHVTTGDLGKPTPCAAWNVSELLAHMTVQHYGFAAAARGNGADPVVWQAPAPGSDPVAAYAEAVDVVLAAFAEDGVPEREFALPEIAADRAFPGGRAIGFHLVDYVVHSWDVARSIGLPVSLGPSVLAIALKVAEAVPAGAGRLAPNAAFAPVIEPPDGADRLDRILMLLGRSPSWPDR
ncbi:MAG TPA: TIGR03086 family metal-binding protein [Streptosporangiaceae bacterium]|jgi:uncharacterized protein (TIGR03086 family)